MCAINVWAVNAGASGPAFDRTTLEHLGVAPQQTGFRIASERIRPSMRHFTLTRGMCDCGTVIGAGADRPSRGDPEAAEWLGWLRALPERLPHLTRMALLRLWIPHDDAVHPAAERVVPAPAVDEPLLRDLEVDTLLVLDFR